MTVRYLAREGEPIAALARRFGLSRQTIYNQLARATTTPAPRAPRPSGLDPYRAHLAARLAQFDLPAPVLLRELRAQGYTGGLTILRAAMRPLKAAQIQRVTERFETLPGRQAQADWGECGTITVAGETKRLYVGSTCSSSCSATAACAMRASLRARSSRPSSTACSAPSKRSGPRASCWSTT